MYCSSDGDLPPPSFSTEFIEKQLVFLTYPLSLLNINSFSLLHDVAYLFLSLLDILLWLLLSSASSFGYVTQPLRRTDIA